MKRVLESKNESIKKTGTQLGLALIILLTSIVSLSSKADEGLKEMNNNNQELKSAYFAGGCFWCMEPPFEKLDGVKAVLSGYMGGSKENAKYETVSSGKTEHLEIVRIDYDPTKVSYEKLLEVLWQNIDPTDDGGQFVDRGRQYKSAIFYSSEEEKKLAEASKAALEKSKVFDKPIVTTIRPALEFYPAEDYHQDYYKENPVRYKFYRYNSGRDQFIDKSWKSKK